MIIGVSECLWDALPYLNYLSLLGVLAHVFTPPLPALPLPLTQMCQNYILISIIPQSVALHTELLCSSQDSHDKNK